MMPGRRQLPAYSPVTAGSVAAASGALLTGRDPREDLRALLRRAYGSRDVLLVDSGTSALRLALTAARRAGRTPVALPAYSCYDVATAAQGAGVPVHLYDLEPGSLGPDPASLRAALEAGARTVVVVHLYGIPVDLTAVAEVADAHDALVIEDAAQGVGGSHDGRPLGSHGSLSVLSFGRGKGWTGGGGGALLARDGPGAEQLAQLSGPGFAFGEEEPGALPAGNGRGAGAARGVLRLGAQWLLGRPSLYGLAASLPLLRLGETIHRSPRDPGPMAPAWAAAALASRARALREAESRARLGERLAGIVEASGRADVAGVGVPRSGTAGYLRFPIVAASAGARARMLEAPSPRLGIMPGYPRPLEALAPFRRDCVVRSGPTPGAETLAARLLTLPTHGLLTGEDRRALEGWLRAGGATS